MSFSLNIKIIKKCLRCVKSFLLRPSVLITVAAAATVFLPELALAAKPKPTGGGVDLAGISSALTGTVKSLSTILVNVSVISGVGFICVAFFKFHAHRNNPQQVPLGQGIGLLVIGAGLTLFPHLLTGVTKAGFGASALATAGKSITAINP